MEHNFTFESVSESKAKKTWDCNLNGDEKFKNISDSIKAMILASWSLKSDFTLEQLATTAVKDFGLKTKSTDMHALGYTHRKKLLEHKVICEHVEPEAETEESSDLDLEAETQETEGE